MISKSDSIPPTNPAPNDQGVLEPPFWVNAPNSKEIPFRIDPKGEDTSLTATATDEPGTQGNLEPPPK